MESESAVVREYTSSSASYNNIYFRIPYRRNYNFQLSTCQVQCPYRRNYCSSDCNTVLNSLSNSILQGRSITSYVHNTRTIPLHISILTADVFQFSMKYLAGLHHSGAAK